MPSTATVSNKPPKPKRLFAALAGATTGLLVGVLAAGAFIYSATSSGETHAHWWGNPKIGAPSSDMWTRARIAIGGLLALSNTEALYFDRTRDEAGRRLDARCTYRLAGAGLPGRWWSITIYDDMGFLPRSGGGPQAVDATRTGAAGKPWQATVGPIASEDGLWINSRGAGRFHLTLRLYHPDPGVASDFSTLPYPSVTRVACGDDT